MKLLFWPFVTWQHGGGVCCAPHRSLLLLLFRPIIIIIIIIIITIKILHTRYFSLFNRDTEIKLSTNGVKWLLDLFIPFVASYYALAVVKFFYHFNATSRTLRVHDSGD